MVTWLYLLPGGLTDVHISSLFSPHGAQNTSYFPKPSFSPFRLRPTWRCPCCILIVSCSPPRTRHWFHCLRHNKKCHPRQRENMIVWGQKKSFLICDDAWSSSSLPVLSCAPAALFPSQHLQLNDQNILLVSCWRISTLPLMHLSTFTLPSLRHKLFYFLPEKDDHKLRVKHFSSDARGLSRY